ncbi:MAG: DNA/RNA helicase domain-containing protein [Anaerohalosphaeraceae bacterium]
MGELVQKSELTVEQNQINAWSQEIDILKKALISFDGWIFLEYSIPRMGRRVDAILLIGSVIFVIEFKVGERNFHKQAIDQVWDYALDLKNFHEPSHDAYIAPILVPTLATKMPEIRLSIPANDKLFAPICCTVQNLNEILSLIYDTIREKPIEYTRWIEGRYSPTPTIIEAAMALYNGHSVKDISRTDAGAINLKQTSDVISSIICETQKRSRKAICFVTGVPGAGKTLVGLNIATKHIDKENALHSVYLSGNGPLVAILREALARDKLQRMQAIGQRGRKSQILSEVKTFIQNVHHFRDECLRDMNHPPLEHVVLFDEAQRAWNQIQTSRFMRQKKKIPLFNESEPEYLISCMDRHPDWAVIVCLVGGGQEIHTGEAGIGEWIDALIKRFRNWTIYLSPMLTDSEYGAGEVPFPLNKF